MVLNSELQVKETRSACNNSPKSLKKVKIRLLRCDPQDVESVASSSPIAQDSMPEKELEKRSTRSSNFKGNNGTDGSGSTSSDGEVKCAVKIVKCPAGKRHLNNLHSRRPVSDRHRQYRRSRLKYPLKDLRFHVEQGKNGKQTVGSRDKTKSHVRDLQIKLPSPNCNLPNGMLKSISGTHLTSVGSEKRIKGSQPMGKSKKKFVYPCKKCTVIFSSVLLFQKHVCSGKKATLNCSICNKEFQRKGNLTCHMRVHLGDQPQHGCKVCNESFSSRQMMLVHKRTHSRKPVIGCKHCNWPVPQRARQLRKRTNEKNGVCEKCGGVLGENEQSSNASQQLVGEKEHNISVEQQAEKPPGQLIDMPACPSEPQPSAGPGKPETTVVQDRSETTAGLEEQVNHNSALQPHLDDEPPRTLLKDIDDQSSAPTDQKKQNRPRTFVKCEKIGGEQHQFASGTEPKKLSDLEILSPPRRIDPSTRQSSGYTCDKCGKSFLQANQLTLHRIMHSSKVTKPGNRLIGNVKDVKGRMGNRQVKGVNRTNSQRLTRPTFVCGTCGKTFTEKFEFNLHKLFHTNDNDVDSDEKNCNNSCSKCNRSFASRRSFVVHKCHTRSIRNRFECRKCERSFMYQHKFDEHICNPSPKKLSKRVALDKAPTPLKNTTPFKSVTTSKSDQLDQPNDTESDDKPYKCRFCDRAYKFFYSYMFHMVMHPPNKLSEVNDLPISKALRVRSSGGRNGVFACKICGKRFTRHETFVAHNSVHTGVKPYNCSKCVTGFNYVTSFKNHKCNPLKIKEEFQNKKIGRPKSKKTTANDNITEPKNIRTKHTGSTCNVCGESFRNRFVLLGHLKKHKCKTISTSQLESEGSKISKPTLLRQTIRASSRSYKCDVCHKSFRNVSSLHLHKRSHKVERRRKCCSEKYYDFHQKLCKARERSFTRPNKKGSGKRNVREANVDEKSNTSEKDDDSKRRRETNFGKAHLHSAYPFSPSSSPRASRKKENRGHALDVGKLVGVRSFQPPPSPPPSLPSSSPPPPPLPPPPPPPSPPPHSSFLPIIDQPSFSTPKNNRTPVKLKGTFQCGTCERSFIYYARFATHESMCMSQSRDEVPKKTKPKMDMISETGTRPYKCNVCHKAFRNIISLNIHKNSHKMEKKKCFECDRCGKKFSREYYYTLHQKICKARKQSTTPNQKGLERKINSVAKARKKIIKKEPNGDSMQTKCGKCNKVYPRKCKAHKNIFEDDNCETRMYCYDKKTNATRMRYKCKGCLRVFKHQVQYTMHKCSIVQQGSYKCDLCEKSFNNELSLKFHNLKLHMIGFKWDERFRTYRDAVKNVFKTPNSGAEINKLRAVDRSFSDGRSFKKEAKCDSDEKNCNNSCSKCNRSFASHRSFVVHKCQTRSLRNRFECRDCKRSFMYQHKFDVHICNPSPKKISKRVALDKAVTPLKHLTPSKSEIPANSPTRSKHVIQAKSPTPSEPVMPAKSPTRLKSVPPAKSRTTSKRVKHSALRRSVKRFQPLVVGGETRRTVNLCHQQGTNKCNLCDTLFIQPSSLYRHQRQMHGASHAMKRLRRKKMIKSEENKPATPFTCGTCDQEFVQMSELSDHMRGHTMEKVHKCFTCSQVFRVFRNFEEHMVCHEQPATRSNNHELIKNVEAKVQEEVRGVQKDVSDVSTEVVGTEEPTVSKLKSPQLPNAKETVHKCSIPNCDKVFNSKTKLALHSRIHKPNRCKICKKSFKTSNDLQVHARIHSGLKPYKCVVCKKSFAIIGKLIEHTRSHVRDQPVDDETDNLDKNLEGNHPTSKDAVQVSEGTVDKLTSEDFEIHVDFPQATFQCGQCLFTCNHMCTMRDHISTHETSALLTAIRKMEDLEQEQQCEISENQEAVILVKAESRNPTGEVNEENRDELFADDACPAVMYGLEESPLGNSKATNESLTQADRNETVFEDCEELELVLENSNDSVQEFVTQSGENQAQPMSEVHHKEPVTLVFTELLPLTAVDQVQGEPMFTNNETDTLDEGMEVAQQFTDLQPLKAVHQVQGEPMFTDEIDALHKGMEVAEQVDIYEEQILNEVDFNSKEVENDEVVVPGREIVKDEKKSTTVTVTSVDEKNRTVTVTAKENETEGRRNWSLQFTITEELK